MAQTKIDISELKNEGSSIVDELKTFLEEKAKVKAELGTSEITVEGTEETQPVSRTYLRVLLRKYLHRSKLKEYYRVIAAKDNTLIIKEKRTAKEEEE